MSENNNKIFTWVKDNWKDCLIIIAVFVIIVLIMSTTCVNQKNKYLANNIKALTDTIQVLELDNSNLLYDKQTLILKKDELESYLGLSKKEVKELEKKLDASLAMIAKLKGQIKVDTLYIKDSIYISEKGDTIKSLFDYTDTWVAIDGYTMIIDSTESNTQINKIEMNVPLKLGLTDNYQIFATSENPYVSFTEIDAAVLENSIANQKKKRWGIGPYIGVGIGGGTDFKGNPQFGWNVSVGVAVTYSLFQW